MRAKLDENMLDDAARLLTETGWETSTVHDEHLVGAADQLVVTVCQREDRVLFPLDLDVSDIRRYPPEEYSGIVVLRPDEPDRDSVLALLASARWAFAQEPVRRRLWIEEPGRIRIRGVDETNGRGDT